MIGTVAMDVGETEMIAAVEFYLNQSVFSSAGELRKYHRARVRGVRQRSNGRFVIEFDGLPEPGDDTAAASEGE